MLRLCCFFFKQKTAYEMRISDWSSDVCSSDLQYGGGIEQRIAGPLTIGLEYLRTNIKDGDYTVAAGVLGKSPIFTGFQQGLVGQGGTNNSPTDIRRSEPRYRIDSLRLTLGYRF